MFRNTVTRLIEWGDCDPAGIVFNPNFFSYFDHATALLYDAIGWPKSRMLSELGAAGCPLVETRATFLKPCRYGETVEIKSEVVSVGSSSFEIVHTLSRDDTVCVEGREKRVWTVRDAETGQLRSQPLPEDIRARLLG